MSLSYKCSSEISLVTILFCRADSHEDYAGCHVPLVNSPGATSLHLKLRRFLKPPALLSPDITLFSPVDWWLCDWIDWSSAPHDASVSLHCLPWALHLFCSVAVSEWVSMLCCVIPLSVCTRERKQRERVRNIRKSPIAESGVLQNSYWYDNWVTKSTPVWSLGVQNEKGVCLTILLWCYLFKLGNHQVF